MPPQAAQILAFKKIIEVDYPKLATLIASTKGAEAIGSPSWLPIVIRPHHEDTRSKMIRQLQPSKLDFIWLTSFVLRFMACSICLALLAIFLPTTWMQAIHASIGLGELPAMPINEYLTRSLSAMYFAHGALLLTISFDVRSYQRLVLAIGRLHILLGVLFFGIDVWSGLPVLWIIAEGPPICAGGILLTWLHRRINSQIAAESSANDALRSGMNRELASGEP